MRKRVLRAIACAVCAALALALCAVVASRAIWGRTLYATIYEWHLRRHFATSRTPETEVERLEARRAVGEPRYELPEGFRFDVSVGRATQDGVDCFTLNAEGDGVCVFFLHGGAFINNFNAHHWRFLNRLARETGCEVFAPNYHLAPFGNCERAFEELVPLYAGFAAARAGRRIVLMGDSAGGGLALGLAQALVREGLPLPERLVLFSPWVDLSMDNPDIASLVPVDPVLHLGLVKVHGVYWADDLDVHDPRVSALFGEMAGLPPVTLYTGTRELLYPDLLLLNAALEGAGVAVDFHIGHGLNHEYPLMPIPEGARAVREVEALISQ